MKFRHDGPSWTVLAFFSDMRDTKRDTKARHLILSHSHPIQSKLLAPLDVLPVTIRRGRYIKAIRPVALHQRHIEPDRFAVQEDVVFVGFYRANPELGMDPVHYLVTRKQFQVRLIQDRVHGQLAFHRA
jgi:hypothetical protein